MVYKGIPTIAIISPSNALQNTSGGAWEVNHMAGSQGLVGPWLSHKLCSIVNVTSILFMKAAIYCSHHQLHGDIQINFIYFEMMMQLIILGVSHSFVYMDFQRNN